MYISQNIADRIKSRAKERNINIGEMLSKCELGINTVSKIAKGTDILTKNFAKIADYLDCSVDYLLGRTDDPELHTLKANNKTSEVKLQIPIKKEAPKASENDLQFIRTAASTGNTGMDNGYKAPKQPYSKKDRAEIKKLKDIEDLE